MSAEDQRAYWTPRRRGAGSGGTLLFDSNTARQDSESCDVFCRRQPTIRFTSGISVAQSRQTSGVQASCCSKVPRYSSADAGACKAILPAIAIASFRTIRCTDMSGAPFVTKWRPMLGRLRTSGFRINGAGQGSKRSKKCEDARHWPRHFGILQGTGNDARPTPPCRFSSPPRSGVRNLPRQIL
jgi:hypothetical protein